MTTILRVKVERCDLATPDIIMINHERAGLLLLVDHRVHQNRVDHALQVLAARAAMHPERVTAPACFQPGPGRVAVPTGPTTSGRRRGPGIPHQAGPPTLEHLPAVLAGLDPTA